MTILSPPFGTPDIWNKVTIPTKPSLVSNEFIVVTYKSVNDSKVAASVKATPVWAMTQKS